MTEAQDDMWFQICMKVTAFFGVCATMCLLATIWLGSEAGKHSFDAALIFGGVALTWLALNVSARVIVWIVGDTK